MSQIISSPVIGSHVLKQQVLSSVISIQSGPSYPPDDANHVNMVSGLSAWRIARDAGAGKVIVLGDSIGAGVSASPSSSGFMQKIITQLQTTYGNGGEFLGAFNATDQARWTKGTGWANGNWGVRYSVNNLGGGTGTLTATFTGTSFEFYALRASSTGNGLIFKIDGSQVANIGLSQAQWNYQKATATVAAGSHTVDVTLNTGTTIGSMSGILARSGTGPIITNNSTTGWKSTNYGDLDYTLKHLQVYAPDLTIIELTANDYLSQTALATYTTTITNIVTYAKAGGGSVLLLTAPESSTINAITQASYEAVMLSIAQSLGCAFMNIGGVWGNWATANAAGYMADFIHPNTAGHLAYYNDLIRWL